MTREEIKTLCKEDRGSLNFELHSPAFGSTLIQSIYIPTLNWQTGEKETDIDNLATDYITDCVNSFLALDSSKFTDKLKDDIYRFFIISIESTDYGLVPEELIAEHGNTEANRLFFKGENKDAVFSNCKFHSVFYENGTGPELRFSIHVKIGWDMEHGLTIYFENGEYVNIE